ncbi:hypothetical protein PoB_000277800 [Plakobranchus ocellatus]|uniref:Uncharacterized protein n=1 Tax=Plakobranchus ocellatus TaxID=259542 RepID=A0AAV3Y1N9_9GAST|nr:hypothetical protein PoB_000277800 [Plakobranchus ocellatus]
MWIVGSPTAVVAAAPPGLGLTCPDKDCASSVLGGLFYILYIPTAIANKLLALNSEHDYHDNGDDDDDGNDVHSQRGASEFLYIASPQQGDLRLSGPPSGQGAGSGARTRDRRVPADLKADSQATVLPTPPQRGATDCMGLSLFRSHDTPYAYSATLARL